MMRKIRLANCLKRDDWKTVEEDLNRRPVKGIQEGSSRGDILHTLEKYGITSTHVELWGTGEPLREFLWSEDMADACVYIMEHVDFSDLKGREKEIRNFHINIGTGI
jgi:GDP-L-fucose synthase